MTYGLMHEVGSFICMWIKSVGVMMMAADELEQM